ncbi:hypothetical protein D3C73_1069160 [compost metagenome]
MEDSIVGNEANAHALKLLTFLFTGQASHHVAWVGVHLLAHRLPQLAHPLEVLVRDDRFTPDLNFTVEAPQLLRDALEEDGIVRDVITHFPVTTRGRVLQVGFVVQQVDRQTVMLEFHLGTGWILEAGAPIGQLRLVIQVTQAQHWAEVLDLFETPDSGRPDEVQRGQRIVGFTFEFPQFLLEGIVHGVFDTGIPFVVIEIVQTTDLCPEGVNPAVHGWAPNSLGADQNTVQLESPASLARIATFDVNTEDYQVRWGQTQVIGLDAIEVVDSPM